MSTARVFVVENQLARIVNEPGGKTIEQAVKSAEQRVEAVRETCVAALAGKAELLVAAAAAGRKGEDPGALQTIYEVSNAIFGIAGTFDLRPLAEAAFSLCDLADGFRAGETPSWPAIDVHVDGIRLLAVMGEAVGAAGAESILDGLRRVRARVLPPQ